MAVVWYVKQGEINQGPYSLTDLNDLAEAGILNRESFVKSEQMSSWVKAGDLPGLSFPVLKTGFNEPPPLQSPPPVHFPAAPPPMQPVARKDERSKGGRSFLKTIFKIILAVVVLAVVGFIVLVLLDIGNTPIATIDNGVDTVADLAGQTSDVAGDPYIVEEPIRQWLSSLDFNDSYELVFVDELDLINTGQDADQVILVYEIVSSHDNRFTVLLGVAYSEWFARLYIKPIDGLLTVTDFEEVASLGSQD